MKEDSNGAEQIRFRVLENRGADGGYGATFEEKCMSTFSNELLFIEITSILLVLAFSANAMNDNLPDVLAFADITIYSKQLGCRCISLSEVQDLIYT